MGSFDSCCIISFKCNVCYLHVDICLSTERCIIPSSPTHHKKPHKIAQHLKRGNYEGRGTIHSLCNHTVIKYKLLSSLISEYIIWLSYGKKDVETQNKFPYQWQMPERYSTQFLHKIECSGLISHPFQRDDLPYLVLLQEYKSSYL